MGLHENHSKYGKRFYKTTWMQIEIENSISTGDVRSLVVKNMEQIAKLKKNEAHGISMF